MKRPVFLFAVISAFLVTSFSYSQVPTNDNPANATSLTVGWDSCSSKTEGSTVGASNSEEGGTSSCNGTIFSDVWYTAEVPASGNLIIEIFNKSGTDFDSVLTVYSGGTTPGDLIEVACNDDGGVGRLSKVVLTGQTPHAILYIRVWGFNGDRDPFEICAWEFTPPTNNNPANAIGLTVGSGCSSKTAGSTELASNSEEGGTPSCNGTISSDVWYKAVVPTSGNLAIETFNKSGTFFNSVLTVYSGMPENLTEVACDDDGGAGLLSKVVLTGQTPDAILYIRVWGSDGDRDPFEICAWRGFTPPDNNNPADATPLTVGLDSCSSKTAGSTELASNSEEGGTPSCNRTISSDLWYTAKVPASGNLIIETFNKPGTYFDSVLTVYSGGTAPGSLVEVACDDNGGTNGLSKVVLTGQTPDAILYIRVWGSNGHRAPFEICAWDNAPLNTEDVLASFLKVYPNPSTNGLFIHSSVPIEKTTVYTLTGARVLTVLLLSQTKPRLDVSELAAGVYVLEIENAKGNQYTKFIKK